MLETMLLAPTLKVFVGKILCVRWLQWLRNGGLELLCIRNSGGSVDTTVFPFNYKEAAFRSGAFPWFSPAQLKTTTPVMIPWS